MEDLFKILVEGFIEFIKWFFGQLLIEIIFYGIGRITLLMLTLGRYPRGKEAYNDTDTITLVGLAVSAILFFVLYKYIF